MIHRDESAIRKGVVEITENEQKKRIKRKEEKKETSGATSSIITCALYGSQKETEKEKGREHVCSVARSCLTLCDPRDCSLPGSSVHGILQARILECVAISFSRESS